MYCIGTNTFYPFQFLSIHYLTDFAYIPPPPALTMRSNAAAPLVLRLLRAPTANTAARRNFSSTSTLQAKNRIYPNRIRNEDEFQTLLLMSASSRVPLLTLWRTQWCSSCGAVAPLLRELIETEGVGEAQGGVSFVEVEMDSPDLGGVGGVAQRYTITSIPTLLAFDRQEAQIETRVTRLEDLKSRAFLTRWIETEAARQGDGGAGGSLFGLLGKWLK